MWKRYSVFNVEQADGLKLPERKGAEIPKWKAQQNVEKVIRANGVPIREVPGDKAAYNLVNATTSCCRRARNSRPRKAITRPRSMTSGTAPATRPA